MLISFEGTFTSFFKALLGIRDILLRIRIIKDPRINSSLTNGSGCGSGMAKWILWIRIWMRIRNTGKKSWRSLNLMARGSGSTDGSGAGSIAGSGAGSLLVTNGSGCGSGMHKNIMIRGIRMQNPIPNTAWKNSHLYPCLMALDPGGAKNNGSYQSETLRQSLTIYKKFFLSHDFVISFYEISSRLW